MDMSTVPTWATVLAVLLGGGVGAFILNLYNARNKNNLDTNKQVSDSSMADNKLKTELRISENEQAFKIYKDLLDNLRKDVSKMTDDMSKLEDERLKYREENASLKAEIRAMQREIDGLKLQIEKNSLKT